MRAIDYYMQKYGWQVTKWAKETIHDLIIDETLERERGE